MLAKPVKCALLIGMFFLSIQPIFSQRISRNDYKGAWETPTTWDPVWPEPKVDIVGGATDFVINGYITVNSSLNFTTAVSVLTINDTLVIKGNLTLGNNADLILNNNAVLIILGDLNINNQTISLANGTMVVMGNVFKMGTDNQGQFTSANDPAKVYIGGSVPQDLANSPAYPVLDIIPPFSTTPYPNSGKPFGDMLDVKNDAIYDLIADLCGTAVAGGNSPVCNGSEILLSSTAGTTYSWTGPDNFTSTLQNPVITSAVPSKGGTYIVNVFANGCKISDDINITVVERPSAVAASVSPVCDGSALNLTSSGGTVYSWTGPNGFISALKDPVISGAGQLAAGSYTVIVTDANGCKDTASTNVTITPLPVVSINSGNDPLCVNAQRVLTGSPAGGTFTVTSGPGIINDNVLTATGAGTISILYTYTDVCTNTAEQSIIANAIPVAVAGVTAGTICAGTTINLTSSGGISSGWTGPDGFTSSARNPSLMNAGLSMSGTYTVTVTDDNGCTDQESVTVTVTPLPSVSITSSSDPVCANTTRSLTGTPGGGIFSIISGPGSIAGDVLTVNGGGIIEILYSYTDACTNTAVQSITAYASPDAVAGVNVAAICEGSTIELTSSGGVNYSWSGPGGFISTDQNPAITNAVVSMSGAYTVTVTDGNGCSDSESVTLSVFALPVFTSISDPMCVNGTRTLTASPSGGSFTVTSGPGSLTGDVLTATGTGTINIRYSSPSCGGTTTQSVIVNANPLATAGINAGTICEGTNINLTSSGGLSYLWTGPGSFTSTDKDPVISNATADMSGIYTITVTDANGCADSESVTANVTSLPTVSITSSSDPLCIGLTRTLTGSPAGGTFTVSEGPGSITGNVLTATGEGTIVISYSYTDVCSNTAVQSIIVNDPVAVAGVNSPTVCAGSTINLTSSGGDTYSWTGPLSFTSTEQNPGIPNATGLMSGSYTVTVTVAGGCTDSEAVNVTVNGTSSVVTITSSSIPMCVDDQRTLTSSTAGGTFAVLSGPGSISGDVLTATGQGTIELLYSVVDGTCSSTANQTITVNDNPVAVAGVNVGTICSGTSIDLTSSAASTYDWTGPDSFTSNAQNPSIANSDPGMSGLYTVTVTDINGCKDSESINVIVTALPSVSITSSGDPICVNAQRTLTGFPGGGTFTVTSGPGTISGTVLTATGPGTIDIKYTFTDVCTNNATQSIISNTNPIATAGVNAGTICAGTTINLTSSGGIEYNWTGPNGLSGSAQFPGIPHADLSMSGVYTVIVTDVNGCMDSESVNVTVTDLPVVSITSSADALCVNAPRTLTGLPSGGTFTVASGPGTITGDILTATGAGVINILYTYTDNCTNTASQSIVSNATPVVVAGVNAGTICTGNTIYLTSSGGETYSWTGPASFTSNLFNPSIPASDPGMSGIYTVTVTDANGCTGQETVDVTVTDLPVVSITSSGDPICVNSSRTLTGFPSGGTFTVLDGPGHISGDVLTATGPGTIDIVYTYTDACTNMANQSLIVNAVPVVSAGVNTGTICAGSAINLTSSGGVSYSWTGPGGFVSNEQNPIIPIAATSMSGTYIVTATGTNGCSGQDNVDVSITALPVVIITSSSDPLCINSRRSLTAVPAGGTFSVSGPGSIDNDILTATGTGTINVTYTYTGSCTNTINQSITVHASPVAVAGVNSSTLCAGTTMNLTSSGGVRYSWAGPGGFTSTVQNPSVPDIGPAMAGLYTVIVTDEWGCTDSESVTLNVASLPAVNITSSADPLCVGAQRILTGSPAGGSFTVINGPGTISGNILSPSGTGTINIMYTYTSGCSNSVSQNINVVRNPVAFAGDDKELNFAFETQMNAELVTPETGEWSVVSGSGNIVDKSSPVSEVTGLSIGQNIFLWTVSNAGCISTDEVVIKINDLFVPSIITPNNDGKNDHFEIIPLIGRTEIIIFNRWGIEEYSNSDYLNNWDGRNNKGKALPDDTYFYVVKFGNGIVRKGTLIIKR